MPRRPRTSAITCALVASATLVVTACGGDADGGPSSASSSTSTSSTSSSTSSSQTEESSPTDEPTPNPYAINCQLITQEVVDEWAGDVVPEGVETTDEESSDGEESASEDTEAQEEATPVAAEETENGCRVVSSSEEGALIVQWQYLDVPGSSDDEGLVDEVSKGSEAVEIGKDLTAVRSESDVAPTRKTRLYVTFDNSRTLYAEATATLDRPRDMADLRRMTKTIVTTYADQPPQPTPPVDPEDTAGSKDSEDSPSPGSTTD